MEQSLEALVAFLRSESFAVRTYDAAMAKVGDAALRTELRRIRRSHARRVRLLRGLLAELGHSTEDHDAPWGAFANAFRRVASARDDGSTLEALHEGERWGTRDYETDLDELGAELRRELALRVLPEQRACLERVSDLARGR